MADPIVAVFTASLTAYGSGHEYTTNAQVWINPPQNAGAPSLGTATPDDKINNWALVLDRAAPSNPPLFQGVLGSADQVPGDLQALMTPAHILIYVSGGECTDLPQGDLFTLLRQNGGGGALHKMQKLSYYNGPSYSEGHGMMNGLLYALVSVPGSNLPGIETLVQSGSGDTLGPIDKEYTIHTANIQTVLTLAPSLDGYDPVEIG